jgi:hypothetical protein
MKNLALFIGLLVVVAVALLFEHLVIRRRTARAAQIIRDGVDAHLLAEGFALQAALDHAQRDTLVAPLLDTLLLQTPTPRTWQGTGGETPETASVREQTAPANYSTAPAPINPGQASVVGRISSRSLVTLQCKACGADLIPILSEALISGCPCTRRASRQVRA